MNCFTFLQVFVIGIWLLSFGWLPAASQDATVPTIGSRTNEDPIQVLADWAVKEAGAVGCNPGGCRILVTNFRMPDDVNGAMGVQLADELSGKIGDSQKEIQAFNRDLFKSYMETSHPSVETLNSDQSMSALASQLGAKVLITANTVRVQGDTFRVSVRLMNAINNNMAVSTEVVVTRVAPPIASATAITSGGQVLIRVVTTCPIRLTQRKPPAPSFGCSPGRCHGASRRVCHRYANFEVSRTWAG